METQEEKEVAHSPCVPKILIVMRFLPILAVLLFAGCPAPQRTPEGETPPPPEIKVAPSTDPVAASTPAAPVNTPDIASFEGVWSTTDESGKPFDIIIFPKGQAISTWTKSLSGPRGERGFWRKQNGCLLVVYDDGWTDIITPNADGTFQHAGYAPETALDGTPARQTVATRVAAPQADFVGVWRLNKEPDGSYLYVTLLSSGRAISTINGGTEGQWVPKDKGALCTWPDGWMDLLERSPEGWQKRSWVGTPVETTPADFSPAERVGEKPFSITP